MTNSLHLLVVEDDPELRSLLTRYFSGQGFTVSSAGNGDEMRTVVAREPVAVILLDLGLPGEGGLELTRELRRDWHGALIIVTGRGESVDRVVGLELGADDYVTKPFDLRELLARVRSVLRRSAAGAPAPAATAGSTFYFAGYRLDPLARTLHARDDREIPLTGGEYELLHLFLQHPHRVLSRDALMDAIHGRSAGPFDRAIDVQVGRLRRKIEADPARPELIKSVRGAGYLFATRVNRGDS